MAESSGSRNLHNSDESQNSWASGKWSPVHKLEFFCFLLLRQIVVSFIICTDRLFTSALWLPRRQSVTWPFAGHHFAWATIENFKQSALHHFILIILNHFPNLFCLERNSSPTSCVRQAFSGPSSYPRDSSSLIHARSNHKIWKHSLFAVWVIRTLGVLFFSLWSRMLILGFDRVDPRPANAWRKRKLPCISCHFPSSRKEKCTTENQFKRLAPGLELKSAILDQLPCDLQHGLIQTILRKSCY